MKSIHPSKGALIALIPIALVLLDSRSVSAQSVPGFKEFSDRVQEYVQLHKQAEEGLPTLRKTDDPQEIATRQQELVKKIRELRRTAKRGDIFTPAATRAFARAIKTVFASPTAPSARATIRYGEPLKEFQVQVNQVYPSSLPFTTVPPTLLLALPKLPDQVAYRMLGTDLLLVDQTISIIVDFVSNVIPQGGV